ncbi:MAG: hypothetical protein NW200_13140 [Hyphomonadaceae bacterium]|nr:hypothetical protein [Hyphomonadaceae bacterium]
MIRTVALMVLVGLAAPAFAPAFAQAPPDVRAGAPTSVAVTVYRDNLALITETRRVDLPGGPVRIVFDGVLDRAIPQSAVVRGLEGAERERNFDFDGLNPMSLLWRSIGAAVRVVRTNPGTGAETAEEAVVQAAGDGVVLRFADRAEALGCAGLPEKLVFARIPEGLTERPALSTVLDAAAAGPRELTLSYLATGLEWETDYVVTMSEDGARGTVTAWITLTNDGEEGFRDAQVGVVAGDLSRTWSPETQRGFQRIARRACWPQGTTSDFPPPAPPPPPPPPPPMPAAMMAREAMADEKIVVTGGRARREELADYQLYALAERTGVAARQTKQVMFLSKDAVAFTRVLRHQVDLYDESPAAAPGPVLPTVSVLRTRNEEALGLGEPLPRGTARVFQPFADRGMLFAGDTPTRDTPVGLEWELATGETHDVTAQDRVVSRTKRALSGARTRIVETRAVEIANASAKAQTVEIVQPVMGSSQRVDRASADYAMKYGAPTWTLQAPPGARLTLTYRLRYIDD